MRFKILVAAFVLSAACVLSASTFTCQPTDQLAISTTGSVTTLVGGGNTSATCSGVNAPIASAGNVITSLRISFLGSYSDSTSGDVHEVHFVTTNTFAGLPNVTADTTGTAIIGTTGNVLGGILSGLSTTGTGAITVNVATSLTAGVVGNVLPATAQYTVQLITTEAGTVPEPVTFGLIGAGLVGLAVARWRRA